MQFGRDEYTDDDKSRRDRVPRANPKFATGRAAHEIFGIDS
jgi:hypothetical protein